LTQFFTYDIIVIQTITIKFKYMREVINISLPSQMAKTVKTAVKKGSYSSTSEFFRDLLRDWQEGKVLAELNKSRVEISSGKGKVLKSLKSLR
jgi:Arc/MetJ-type ribon-helix-helix transcriptional regulator